MQFHYKHIINKPTKPYTKHTLDRNHIHYLHYIHKFDQIDEGVSNIFFCGKYICIYNNCNSTDAIPLNLFYCKLHAKKRVYLEHQNGLENNIQSNGLLG